MVTVSNSKEEHCTVVYIPQSRIVKLRLCSLGFAVGDARSRSYTAFQLVQAKLEEEDYVQMHTSASSTPELSTPSTGIHS